jgi:hypothetical protein
METKEQSAKQELLAMEMDEKEIDLALEHSKDKSLEGLLEWITQYQDDPSMLDKKDTKMDIEEEGGEAKVEEKPKEEGE